MIYFRVDHGDGGHCHNDVCSSDLLNIDHDAKIQWGVKKRGFFWGGAPRGKAARVL